MGRLPVLSPVPGGPNRELTSRFSRYAPPARPDHRLAARGAPRPGAGPACEWGTSGGRPTPLTGPSPGPGDEIGPQAPEPRCSPPHCEPIPKSGEPFMDKRMDVASNPQVSAPSL